jgi:putative FmdB family regulatory protein
MPLYDFECSNASCVNATTTIEMFAKSAEVDAQCCPLCNALLKRVISAANSAIGQSHLLKEKHFSERGFTQYKKIGGGVYEKTAGDGPRYISGDQN